MKDAILVLQVIIAVSLMAMILVQSKGTGFGRSVSASSFTRRGLEKLIFKLTFIFSAIFIVISILQLFI